jgi:uncharacterized YigZ family protein
MEEYPVPAGRHRVELVVRRSRFIATLAPASDSKAALAVVEHIRDEFPDATHHCWAYVAGPPGSTSGIGLSDDGEPHGTAGRPILQTLLHSGVGGVVAVVTRYFGGVKLGTGGLGRAYSEAASQALATLPVQMHTRLVPVGISAPFYAMDPLIRMFEEVGGREREDRFGEGVEFVLRVPAGRLDHLRSRVAEITAGAGVVEVIA